MGEAAHPCGGLRLMGGRGGGGRAYTRAVGELLTPCV